MEQTSGLLDSIPSPTEGYGGGNDKQLCESCKATSRSAVGDGLVPLELYLYQEWRETRERNRTGINRMILKENF